MSPFHPESGLVNWSHFHKNVSVFNTIKVGSLKMIEAKSKERKQAAHPHLLSSITFPADPALLWIPRLL